MLVGSAVEHAAGLAGMPARMVEIIRRSEADDETACTLADLLGLLGQAFPIEAVHDRTADGAAPRPERRGPRGAERQLLDAINGLASNKQPMRAVTPKAVGAVLQRNVQGVPIDDGNGSTWFITPEVGKRTNNHAPVDWTVTDKRPGGTAHGGRI